MVELVQERLVVSLDRNGSPPLQTVSEVYLRFPLLLVTFQFGSLLVGAIEKGADEVVVVAGLGFVLVAGAGRESVAQLQMLQVFVLHF